MAFQSFFFAYTVANMYFGEVDIFDKASDTLDRQDEAWKKKL